MLLPVPLIQTYLFLLDCCCGVSLFLKRMIRPSSLQNHCRAKNIFESQKEILEAEMEGLAKAMGYDINGGIKETLNKSAFP